MGWFRKLVLKIVLKEIKENGIQIGEYRVIVRNGTLTFANPDPSP